MGLFDTLFGGLFGGAAQQGAQTTQNVTGTQPRTPSGGTYVTPAPSSTQRGSTQPSSTVNAQPQGTVSAEPVSNPTESMWTFPFYTALHSASEWWSQTIVKPYADYVEPRLAGRGPWEAVGQAGIGFVSAPGAAAEFIGMIPAGSERLIRETARDPMMLPALAGAGLLYQYESIRHGMTTNPARTTAELIGTGLVLHGAGKAIGAFPVKPGFDYAVFGESRFLSLGIRNTFGATETFRPLVGIKYGESFRPTGLTPRLTPEILGSKPMYPVTPLETTMAAKFAGAEAPKIGLGLEVRRLTQGAGLRLHDIRPVVQEIVSSHNIPRASAVSNVIVSTMKEYKAKLYGSGIQWGIGEEVRVPGLPRTPRDFDVMVINSEKMGSTLFERINRAAGSEVVTKDLMVKATGEKLFDLHEDAYSPIGSGIGRDQFVGLGLKKEGWVPTTQGIDVISMSEQTSRKLVGSLQLSAEPRAIPLTESFKLPGKEIVGRLIPEKAGRLKDIMDFYMAEKLNIQAGLEKSINPVKQFRAPIADIKLERWLDQWGPDIADTIRIQYQEKLLTGDLRLKLYDFGDVPSPSRAPGGGIPSPSLSLLPGSPSVGIGASPGASPPPSPGSPSPPSPAVSPSPGLRLSSIPRPPSTPRSPSPSLPRSPGSPSAGSPSLPRSPSVSLPRSMPSPSILRSPSLSLPRSPGSPSISVPRSPSPGSPSVPRSPGSPGSPSSPSIPRSPSPSLLRSPGSPSISVPIDTFRSLSPPVDLLWDLPVKRFTVPLPRVNALQWNIKNPVPSLESVMGAVPNLGAPTVRAPSFKAPRIRL